MIEASPDPLLSDRTNVVLREYFRAVNADAWEDLRRVLHEDVVFLGIGAPRIVGADEVVSAIRRFMSMFGTHRDEVTRVLLSGSAATVEIEFRGTTLDGRPISFRALDVMDVVNDRIQSVSNWLDIDTMRRSLQGMRQ